MAFLRHRIPFLRYALFFSLMALTFGCSGRGGEEDDFLSRAREYAERGLYRKAVIEFNKAIELDRENDRTHYELGETYLQLKNGEEAFQSFSRAVTLNPVNLDAQLRMGQILLLGGKTPEARKKAELILETTQNHIDALTLLSGVQVQEQDIDSAVETLRRAVVIEPHRFMTHLSLARLFVLQRDPIQAERSYLEAISLDPTGRVPRVELASLYVRMGEMERAESELKKMVCASGSEYQNLQVLARFYEGAGKWDQAEESYLNAVRLRPDNDVLPLLNLAHYYARRGLDQKGLDTMKQALQIKKGDPDILLALAQLQFDIKRLDEAEVTVDKVLSSDEGNLGAIFLKGKIHLARRHFVDAQDRFDRIIRESPGSALGYYFKALALIGNGERRSGEGVLMKAIELNPQLVDARMILVELYLLDGNNSHARKEIERVLAMDPQNTKALILQGNLFLLEKDSAGAEAAFKEVIRIDPHSAGGHVRLGRFYSLLKRDEEALLHFEKALATNPRHTEALGLMVGIHLRNKRFETALELCAAYGPKMEEEGEAAFVSYLQGNIFQAQGEFQIAVEYFEAAIEKEPDLPAPYLALARLHVQEGKPEEAISRYRAVVEKYPSLSGYMAMGAISDQQGKSREAEVFYRKALEIKPDFAPAANNLAWNLAEQEGDLEEALGYARIAKEKLPMNPAVMDTLGWILFLRGSYSEAVSELQNSVARDPDNPVIHFHLGMAYHKNRESDKAREALSKALSLQHDFKGSEEALKILQEING
jgi:tetratricopeptide (TPR) repeat protein